MSNIVVTVVLGKIFKISKITEMRKYPFIWRRKSIVSAEILVVVYACFGNCLNQGIEAYIHIDCMSSFEKLKLCIKCMSLTYSQLQREYLQKCHLLNSFRRATLICALIFLLNCFFALLGNLVGHIKFSLI